MLYQAGEKVVFAAYYTKDDVQVTDLTDVLFNILRVDVAAGTASSVVTNGISVNAGLGFYIYVYTTPSSGNYVFLVEASTATGDVDTASMAALGHSGNPWVENVDTALSLLATAANLAALNDLSSSDIDTALATYDGPTKAEMDSAIEALGANTSVTVHTTVSGARIGPLYTEATWSFSVTDTDLSLTSWEGANKDLLFAIKTSKNDEDDDAILLVRAVTNLIRIDGAEPVSATNGSLTIDSATQFSIAVGMVETGIDLSKNTTIYWGLKGIDTGVSPNLGTLLAEGTVRIEHGIVLAVT